MKMVAPTKGSAPRREALFCARFIPTVSSRARCGVFGFLRHALNAHQLESQSSYTVEDAVKVRLVDDLPGENSLFCFGFHLHPFEGWSVPPAKLAPHHYPVGRPGLFACTLFAAAFQGF